MEKKTIPGIKELRDQCNSLKPEIQIGKNGITPTVVEHIIKIMKKRPLLKIKLLQASLAERDRDSIAVELEEKTKALVIDQTGFTVVLYKPRKGLNQPRAGPQEPRTAE